MHPAADARIQNVDINAQRHHTGRQEMQTRPDFVPAKSITPAKKSRFREECGEHFIGYRARPGDTAGELENRSSSFRTGKLRPDRETTPIPKLTAKILSQN